MMNKPDLRLRPSSTGDWLVQNSSEQIVSQRPLSLRMICGALAVCLACVTLTILPNLSPLLLDRAAAPGAGTIALMLFSLMFCLLLGTGPNRLCLDLQRRQYSLAQGIFGLTWTRRGQIGNGEIYVSCTRSRQYQVRFRAQHWKYGLPIASLPTEQEAQMLAREIADKLDVKVRFNSIP